MQQNLQQDIATIQVGDLIIVDNSNIDVPTITFMLLKNIGTYDAYDTVTIRGDMYDFDYHNVIEHLGLYAEHIIRVIKSNGD